MSTYLKHKVLTKIRELHEDGILYWEELSQDQKVEMAASYIDSGEDPTLRIIELYGFKSMGSFLSRVYEARKGTAKEKNDLLSYIVKNILEEAGEGLEWMMSQEAWEGVYTIAESAQVSSDIDRLML